MELDHILKLIDAVSDSALTGFELDDGNLKLTLEADRLGKKELEQEQAEEEVATKDFTVITSSESPIESPVLQGQKEPESSQQTVSSPLVGVFYQSSAPDKAPYVQVGDQVKKGQIIGVVEAMKLMNEIESDYDGIVTEILVKDGEMVEYHQPMFVIA